MYRLIHLSPAHQDGQNSLLNATGREGVARVTPGSSLSSDQSETIQKVSIRILAVAYNFHRVQIRANN